MNKKTLFISLLFVCTYTRAQVGIGTQNVQGDLHIDALGNNNKSGNPSTLQLKDDVIIKNDGSGEVSMAIGGSIVKSASIALLSENRGFIPNIVELLSTTDQSTIKSPIEGMVVYNTGQLSDVLPGYYCYAKSGRWTRLTSKWQDAQINKTMLQTTLVASSSESILDFGTLKIEDSGTYVFSFNLSGSNNALSSKYKICRGEYNLTLYKKGATDLTYTKVDEARIAIPMFTAGVEFTYNTFLEGNFITGDIAQIRIQNTGMMNMTNIRFLNTANTGTSLLYWRTK